MPRPQSVDGGAEAEVAVHVDGGKADVDAIEVGDDVEQEQKRNDPPADLAEGRLCDRVSHGVG